MKFIFFLIFCLGFGALSAPIFLEKMSSTLYYILIGIFILSLTTQCSTFYRRFKEIQKMRRDRLSKIWYIKNRHPEELKAPKLPRTSLDNIETECDRYIDGEYKKLQTRICRVKFKPEFETLESAIKEMDIAMEFLEDKVFVTDNSENRLDANQAFSYSEEGVEGLISYIRTRMKNP